MLTPHRVLAAVAVISSPGLAQPIKPMGLVTSTAGAQVRMAGSKLPLKLAIGDLLFTGDTVFTGSGEATIAFCPKSAILNLRSGGEYVVSDREIRAGRGTIATVQAVPVCELPPANPAATRSIQELARKANVPIAFDEGIATDAARFATLFESLKKIEPQGRGVTFVGSSLESREAVGSNSSEPPAGPTYALIVGISKYAKLPPQNWLRFADKDAQKFGELLTNPRGGGLPADQLKLLTNEEATKDAIGRFAKLFLDQAKQNRGTFLLVLAAHGVADEETGLSSIVTHESNPEDLYASGFSMDDLQNLLSDGVAGLGRMLIYVDVCHAAKLGTIKSRNVNRALIRAIPSQAPGKILSFLSSSETEPSWEGENWGGHGAFTYFVLRGLNGDADGDQDGIVTARELVGYVTRMVTDATLDKQHPTAQTFTLRGESKLTNKKDASTFTLPMDWTRLTREQITRRQGQKDLTPPAVSTRSLQEPQPNLVEFLAAILAGRILPGETGSAFDILQNRLRGILTASEYQFAATELRVALENQGQQAILRYLEGDQVEQRPETFRIAVRYFEAARQLSPGSGAIDSRELFCRGRELIFSKTPQGYADAVRFLENAARIDPKGAYSFNGLGIAYLEQASGDSGKFDLAIAAFQDAIRLAPHWVYPRHNLALAYAERGQYDSSIRAYREAMKFGPDYSYLAYNLGLLYQRLNRLNDAEQSYLEALRIAQAARDSGLRPAAQGLWREGAEIRNALGSIEASRPGGRHRDNASKLYRQALLDDQHSRSARHNLALLLSRDGESAEAERLWRQNLADDANDIAARLALADYLDRRGRSEEAAREYQTAIGTTGNFPGIRRKLAAAYLKLNRIDEARAVLERALQDSPSATVFEDLGDLETRAGQTVQAEARYREAEAKFTSRTDRERVRKKREKLASPARRN